MKRLLKGFVLTIMLFSVVQTVPSAWAGEATTGDYLTDIGTKFGRGLWNIVQSPAEPVCGIMDDRQEHKFWGIFTGFGKGVVFMLRRILVGVDEVATFVIPMEPTLSPVCQMD